MDERLAQRAPAEEVIAVERKLRNENPPFASLLDAIPAVLLIVNEHRQVVYANREATRIVDPAELTAMLGRRPGEVLNCVHAAKGCHGCGTAEACSVCGAARALATAEMSQPSVQLCHMARNGKGALDLRVSTTPITFDGQKYSIVSLTDVSDEHRRRALERIFFHDLMNTLGALAGYVQLLDGAQGKEARDLSEAILRLTETLGEEIRAQRDLAAAENNDLAVLKEPINSREILEQVAVQYRTHTVAGGRTITLGTPLDSVVIRSDRRLLKRVLANMVKNALEATGAGGEVTLRCRQLDGHATFSVHNREAMSREVQLQVFGRAFSTKGVGRGLGTYSMKLLGERYLSGEVSFTSDADRGTTFHVRIPL